MRKIIEICNPHLWGLWHTKKGICFASVIPAEMQDFSLTLKHYDMKMPRLKTGFDAMSDPAFQITASHIYACMLLNLDFPTPTPELSLVDEALQAYGTALTAAKTKDTGAIATKDKARGVLTSLLVQLANYVMTTANGDSEKLERSGFDLAKEGETSVIVKPLTISLTDGVTAGEMIVKVSRQKGVISYLPQYTPDPLTEESVWIQAVSSTSKNTLKNLESGKKYWVRVGLAGPYNQLVYSDAVFRVVQ